MGTVMWSFAMRESIDGKVIGPGTFGFQDMVAVIEDPQIAHYTPRTSLAELQEAFETRWVHGMNTNAPWTFIKAVVSSAYKRFLPKPWFIGEYGGGWLDEWEIRSDLQSMQELAAESDSFLGAAFFQFQTAYWKGGSEMNFGLFGLGEEKIGETGEVCENGCHTWPVYCLSTKLSWLPGSKAKRAKALATAWGGSIDPADVCPSERPAGSVPPLKPMRGIAYGALPCTAAGCGGEDMLQAGYEKQWGATGRNDLGVMAKMGANAVRLYHSLGLNVERDHGKFLDYALDQGLNVMPGYHTYGECPEFDCFETWKTATLQGFKRGFQRGSSWHPAISMLILLNEPDFFDGWPQCQPRGAWCHVKAAISALDGVLAAEKEAGVGAGRTKLTVMWSFAMREAIDGKVIGPGTFGFQDMVAVIEDPQIAHYTPRTSLAELQEAFETRWVHGMNTNAPWTFIKAVVSSAYKRFLPKPWFIGEYGGGWLDEWEIRSDLQSMQELAAESDSFLGAAFFQFQTAYWKGGSEMNFGLFGLGEEKIGETGEVCENGCHKWPVYCLTTKLSWLPGSKANRAKALATACGGSIDPADVCPSGRRLGGGSLLV